MTMSLSAAWRMTPSVAARGGFDQRAALELEFAAPELFERAGRVHREGTAGEKAQSADVDAEHRRGRAGDFAGDPEHRAVAAEDQQQVHLRARAPRRRGKRWRLSLAEVGGGGVAKRPAVPRRG